MVLVLTLLAVISALAWVLSFVVYHATSASIHLLLLLAVCCGVLALVMRNRHPRTVT